MIYFILHSQIHQHCKFQLLYETTSCPSHSEGSNEEQDSTVISKKPPQFILGQILANIDDYGFMYIEFFFF